MSAPRFVLEVRDSHGALVTRARVDTLPITIGRGYGCDVIVDDPYLDPVHLRVLEEDGGFVVEDAGSANGLRANGANARVSRVPLARGTILHAGRTTIRYIDPSEPIAPAKHDRAAAWHAPLAANSRLAPRWARAGAVVLCLALVALQKWGETFALRPEREVGSLLVGVVLMLGMWAGLWSLGARLARHPALFTYHLAITSVAVSILLVFEYLSDWLKFLSPQGHGPGLIALLDFVVIIGAIYAQLGLASSLRRWWRIGVVIAPMAVIFALAWIVASEDESKFSAKMSFDAMLKPAPARLVPAQSVSDYEKVLADLRQSVDKEKGAKD